MASRAKRRVLTVVMDGVGVRDERFGNAVALAYTPTLNYLRKHALFTTLLAHGTHVGMPSDSDIGNSEVGHNALGAGRVFDQGAKLVQRAISDGFLYEGKTWQEMIRHITGGPSTATLHFMGLLSDGNVHSHETHLHSMLRRACQQGVKRIRVHALLDGRDVPQKSAETYADRLEAVLAEVRAAGCDAQVASGGGRMQVTMDRYEADWDMVARGWQVHVDGEGAGYASLAEAIAEFRKDPELVDQNFPGFVIKNAHGKAVGPIIDHDAVVFFNFRGDRAIEIARAFEEPDLAKFPRGRVPNVFFAGMTEYDGDLHIPKHYLVSPPQIDNTFGEYLAKLGVRQFACSETQKFGHVTYFWNGNRSGYFNKDLEEYVEIPSDLVAFDAKPWMKAYEIAEATIKRLLAGSFEYGRINFANGDMVGHTGNLQAAVLAMSALDLVLARIVGACRKTDTILLVTADHGNCDEMFDAKLADFPSWEMLTSEERAVHGPKPRTAHTVSPVPFYLFDPRGNGDMKLAAPGKGRLSCLANTALELMGLPTRELYDPSLIV